MKRFQIDVTTECLDHFPSLFALRLDPLIFGADLVGEGLLEVIGEDSPGVGFDFEVGAGFRVIPEIRERGFGVVEGGGEGREGFGIERDVEMDAAFGLSLKCAVFSLKGGEKLRKVSEAGDICSVVEEDLVEVGGFVELTDRFPGFGVLGVEGEGVGEVNF